MTPTFIPEPPVSDIEKMIQDSVGRRAPSVAKSNYASSLGDICERRLVYQRTRGDQALEFGSSLLGVFATGDLVTPLVLERILGPFGRTASPAWSIEEREKTPHDPALAKANIGCRVDGVRHVADATGRMRPYNLVEMKTMSSNMFAGIRTLDDLSVTVWTRKYIDQVLLGMYGCNLVENPGWMILVNKDNLYQVRILEVPFDMDRVEGLLKRADRVNCHVETIEGLHLRPSDRIPDEALPDQIRRPDVCQSCAFLPECSPELVGDPAGAPTIIGPDHAERDELEKILGEFVALEPSRLAADKAKSNLKDRLVPGQRYIVGSFVVEWKTHGKGWRMLVTDTAGK